MDNGKAVGNDEALMGKVLKVIASHAQLRHSENNPVSFIDKVLAPVHGILPDINVINYWCIILCYKLIL